MDQKNIGLALGGGATRGFIHLGVLKYLEEQEYHITEITGTSIGAIIGTMRACGMTYQEMYDVTKSLQTKNLIDFDMSQGLIKGKKIINTIKKVCGDNDFKDLQIPLKIIATNIDTGAEVVFEKGSVLEAISYSISIPGIFTVKKGQGKRDYYVDGGLVNNLPISHLSSKHRIAISCLGLDRYQPRSSTSIWGKKIDTSALTIPKRIVYRSISIMMQRVEDSEVAKYPDAILIRPKVDHLSTFDLSVLDKAVKIGYAAAQEHLE